MEKINFSVIKSQDNGVFHDSRKSCRVLGQAINLLIDKVNELIDENNKLNKKVNDLQKPS